MLITYLNAKLLSHLKELFRLTLVVSGEAISAEGSGGSRPREFFSRRMISQMADTK